jgi:hypothetical protein
MLTESHLFDKQQSDFMQSFKSHLDVNAWIETIGLYLLYED